VPTARPHAPVHPGRTHSQEANIFPAMCAAENPYIGPYGKRKSDPKTETYRFQKSFFENNSVVFRVHAKTIQFSRTIIFSGESSGYKGGRSTKTLDDVGRFRGLYTMAASKLDSILNHIRTILATLTSDQSRNGICPRWSTRRHPSSGSQGMHWKP
jgi:hypothetical protein